MNDEFNFLPIARCVAATTMGLDLVSVSPLDVESKERIKRRDRVRKFKRIMDEESFNKYITQEDYDDLMKIKASPFKSSLFYFDYSYESKSTTIKNKINRILSA